jgi:hypothetical protein
VVQADGISMGLGDALSEKAEVDYVKREYARETWEMDTNPAGEVAEAAAAAHLPVHTTPPPQPASALTPPLAWRRSGKWWSCTKKAACRKKTPS